MAETSPLPWGGASSTTTALAVTGVAVAGSAYFALASAFGGLYDHAWQLPGVALRVGSTVGLTLAKFVARGCKPLYPEWTLPFEISRAVTRCVMSNYGPRMTSPANAQLLRRKSEAEGTKGGAIAGRRNGTTMEPFSANGLEHLWVRAAARSAQPTRRVVVLYFHGGGFVLMSPRMYAPFGSELQRRLRDQLAAKLAGDQPVQVDVLLANYRKAPEFPYPRAPVDALAMYKYLLEEEKVKPRHIIIMGDSAGGALTMTTLLRLRDEDPALLPAAAVLACPFADREHKGDDNKTPHCILAENVSAAFDEAYFGDNLSPATWGDSSPAHCDLRGLPPVYIQAAGLDYLLPQSQRLMEKATQQGLTSWKLEIFPNLPHVFSTNPIAMLPIATKGIDAMAEYAAAQFAKSLVEKQQQ